MYDAAVLSPAAGAVGTRDIVPYSWVGRRTLRLRGLHQDLEPHVLVPLAHGELDSEDALAADAPGGRWEAGLAALGHQAGVLEGRVAGVVIHLQLVAEAGAAHVGLFHSHLDYEM